MESEGAKVIPESRTWGDGHGLVAQQLILRTVEKGFMCPRRLLSIVAVIVYVERIWVPGSSLCWVWRFCLFDLGSEDDCCLNLSPLWTCTTNNQWRTIVQVNAAKVSPASVAVHNIADYRCEASWFPASASCVTISNPDLLSSSETLANSHMGS
jgi:hypothetical protein